MTVLKKFKFDLKSLSSNQLVPWFLMSSYLYYWCDFSLIQDSEFDALCVRLHKEWLKVTHRHRDLITRNDLKAGTGFAIRIQDYPLITQSSAWQCARLMGLELPALNTKRERRKAASAERRAARRASRKIAEARR